MPFEVSNIKRTILGISIALILVLFIGYGINTFYSPPKWEDFCPKRDKHLLNESDCIAAGGEWTVYPKPIAEGKPVSEGYCNPDYSCSKEYGKVREGYNRNVFIIAVVAGLIAVILGGIVLRLETVSAGIMGGGILSILYGTIRYWGDLADVGRFIILGIVLAVLIWIGYKKFKR